ncbi:MAG: tRNA (N6-isopentenyl adenosine(37)-C2)-methylthiotransferase MiaB [Clostridia bacterium]|nr:tRNA (N6-isopentenyl adenosine(37)-C2)-methylthiotransferase MiaB [Clostridia bacterium]MBO7657801.1 tRNA (N6-isopentenyl adenosine(37)-C2)-methylthiotransferase MiaB [Clostridia bacterium]MBR5006737.1 tRNA (N6-isopentenyl adenosine(37)-C2)-methylthiotransferase MiaB [Clostridia bacterium]
MKNRPATREVSREEMEKQAYFSRCIAEKNATFCAEKGRKPLAFVRTFGCQMNEHDSEKIAGMLEMMGFAQGTGFEGADLIVINTCCVRENAEEKVFGHLGALKGLKRANPDLIIAVCGCMTEQPHIVEEIRKTYRHVDLVFGTHSLHVMPELLWRVIDGKTRVFEVSKTDTEVAENVPVKRVGNVHAWVTIMYGCDNFCTYCIVPYVRGRERSRQPAAIVEEIKGLVEAGYKEVTLLGQNVNSYGKDLPEPVSFAALLDMICGNTAIERIRFMTSHPKDISDELIDVMAARPAVCRQLHLPVQCGSTNLLRRMNRHYTREQYLERVRKVREKMPDVALTTDIIVGFPGETEEDFEDTLSLVEEVRFDQAYTFIYSRRVGTPAANYPDQVPDDVVKDRFERLLALQNRISREINDGFLGATVDVLCDGFSKTNSERYTGRTEGNKIVNFTASRDHTGETVKVKIDSVQTWSLEGAAIEDDGNE